MATILTIDSDLNQCLLLDRFLKRKGHDSVFFSNAKKALQYLNDSKVDVVFCDLRLSDVEDSDLLQRIKGIDSSIQVIIITAYSNIRAAVNVIKMGAFDYITKPLLPEEILLIIEKAMEQKKPANSNYLTIPGETVSKRQNQNTLNDLMIGTSKESEKFTQQVELVAPTNYSVIIYGETGTGKESVAHNIHALSSRRNKPFVAVDCGSLTKELAGSELFGHEKGSFTGAMGTKIGQFELANGGTIFLDEIGNLSYEIQVSLLRVVQERKIRRIGSQKEIAVDVRIIVASNEKLNDTIAKGKFREDLYHRFNEFSIDLPSLRERNIDIKAFADFFLQKANAALGKNISGFSPEVLEIFHEYSWPGNLREMNNLIKRATLLSDGTLITLETLPREIIFLSKFIPSSDSENQADDVNPRSKVELKAIGMHAEHEKILEAMRRANYNKSKAATLLNVDRKTLYNKIKAYDLLDKLTPLSIAFAS